MRTINAGRRETVTLAAVLLTAAGCTTNAEFLDEKQAMAVQTADSRGRFELNCPDVQTTVLSREVVEPTYQGPRTFGVDRAEYTLGVAGCGKRATYVVICPDGGDGCFAAGPGDFVRQQ